MKTVIGRLFNSIGLSVSSAKLQERRDRTISEIDSLFELVLQLNGGGHSKSQLKQDVFALVANKFKRNGYFVEFGATNGVDLSNTHLLEKHYDWTGILAEPAVVWHQDLKNNRSCKIVTDCVWSRSGEKLNFDMTTNGELSTISSFSEADMHSKARRNKTTYSVTTISLKEMLEKYRAPKAIDYLSIDTEGSEYEILKAFDFKQYKFNVITVEHNFTKQREDIRELLSANGYQRVFESLSRWDDWYIHKDVGVAP